MNKVSHFEVPADDIARAKKFYNEVFEWQIHEIPDANFHDYHSVMTTPTDENHMPQEVGGINGGLYKRQGSEPTTIVIEVPSIDSFLEKVKKAGGKVVLEKQEVSKYGAYARFKDTEGNLVGLWESYTKP